MGIFAKILIGAAVAGGVGAAVAVAVDSHQQKKAEQKVREAKTKEEAVKAMNARDAREQKSVIQRIKKYVQKKVVKFLAFVALHMDQIEAAGAIIGLGSAVIGIASAVKDYKNSNDTQEKLDWIINAIQNDEKAINHNNKVFAAADQVIMRKLDISAEELDKEIDAALAS